MSIPSRVLVVEDEDDVRELVAEYLRGRGVEVIAARTVEEAMGFLAVAGIELMIVDVRLPDGDGVGLVREARDRAPPVPSVVLTATSSVDAAMEALRAGASDYAVKPVKLRELFVLVGRAWHRYINEMDQRWSLDVLRLMVCAELAEERAEAEGCIEPLRELMLRIPGAIQVTVLDHAVSSVRGAAVMPLGGKRTMVMRPDLPTARAPLLAVHRALMRVGA